MCRLVATQLAALLTAVNNDVPALGIGHGRYRLQRAPARVGAVTGVDVHVQAPKAEWAVVARGVAKRLYLLATVRADEAIIVFRKSFYFHNPSKMPEAHPRFGRVSFLNYFFSAIAAFAFAVTTKRSHSGDGV